MGVGIWLNGSGNLAKWEWETHQNAGGNLTGNLSGIPTKILMFDENPAMSVL